MAIKVNLLKKSYIISDEQLKKEKQVFLYAVVGFVVLVTISVAVFAWSFILGSQLSSLDEELSATKARIGSLANASVKQIYLKERIQLVEEFFSTRVSSREALQRIYSVSLPNVTIMGVSYVGEDAMSVNMEAKDVLALDSAYGYFESGDHYFPQVVNQGVSRNEEGSYSMNLILTLPKEEINNAAE